MHTSSLSEFSRRAFLGRTSQGVGAVALASLLNPGILQAAPSRGVLQNLPLPQKAKRVIWLTMAGGPSQLDLFDNKPKLAEMDGKPMPESLTKGQELAQLQGQQLICHGPQFKFQKFGKHQTELSELLPHTGSIIDDICLVKSMTTDAINHDPAHMFMNTGSQIAGRPSMGTWITYGLGSEAENLPGFVVLTSTGTPARSPQPIAARQWSSGFLPSKYQGVQLRGKGDPVLYLNNPPGITRELQGGDVTAINALNRQRAAVLADPEIATRIAQYELAFQMQASVPDLVDISAEGATTLELYGCRPSDGSFASNCLLARRLAERGTRFIQLYHRDWDHHSQLREELPLRAKEVDRACAALITDLKRRGLFDDTLIVFSGEFGRTPMKQGNKGLGRDHHNKAMSIWLAGAGIQGGLVYGATDDLGYAAAENVTTVHDLHATMLHLLGIQHDAFSYKFQGLDARLTGVEGAKVIKGILT